MDIFSLIIILLAIAIAAIFIVRALKNRPAAPPQDPQSLILLQDRLEKLSQTLDAKLGESKNFLADFLIKQSGESRSIVKEVTSELTKVTETQRQVASVADQLRSLQDILKNPKQRGVLGEYYLETVLKNVLPPGTYQLQYPFEDGTKVDAVIFYQDRVIPIDSKFSLENYNRLVNAASDDERKRAEDGLRTDLKTRIDETSKYIKPAENTLDFAFMFIPSEALYYDLLVNKIGSAAERDLIQYAAEKRVYPVSPTTFYAYLQMALQGIRQIEINKSAEQIRKNVGELQRHLLKYEEYFEKVGGHLQTTMNAYATAGKEFGKIDKDILKIGKIAQEESLEDDEKKLL
jgi:DNA recombination protein RmuC